MAVAVAAVVDLHAYSGPDTACPKCGSPRLLTQWHWAGGVFAPKEMDGRQAPCRPMDDLSGPRGEHLCRMCRDCGYGWPEACLDNQAEAGTRQLSPVPREHGDGPAMPRGGTST